MTRKEIVDRTIGLTFDFLKQLVSNPDALDTLEDGAVIFL